MLKSRLRITSCFLWVALTMLGFYSPNPVKAENYTATATERDFYFKSQEPATLVIRTYAQQYGIDSMLWVYDEQNNVVAANDDHFGLDSYISFQMIPQHEYRLRAGVCCNDPERWYGASYVIEPSIAPSSVGSTTTTTTTTTTIPLYLNPPRNLQITSTNEDTVYLNWDAPESSNVPVERYAVFFSCDNWRTGYAISSTQTSASVGNLESGTACQFKVRSDNDTLSVYSQFTDDVTGTTATTSTTSTTTTTEAPQPPPTTTLVSTTTLPPLVVTTSSSSTSTVPVTTIAVPSTTLPPETTTSTSTTLPVQTTTTTIPVIDESLTPEEAIAIVTSAEVLQELTSEEATEVFDSLEVSELSDEQAEALVEAVQDAPEEVRAAFEEEVNIFDNKFNSYVPIGSNINVGQRKVLVAATGVLFMAPTVSVSSSSTSGTQSDSRKRR